MENVKILLKVVVCFFLNVVTFSWIINQKMCHFQLKDHFVYKTFKCINLFFSHDTSLAGDPQER